jgi:hypothetical protein
MAILSTNNPTLLDVAKRTDPDGTIAQIVELLQEQNEILLDMGWTPGNLPTGHKTTVRTGLPEPTWRKLYGGVQPSKSTTVQVTDTIGNLEAYAEVDKDLADLNGNTEAFRVSEDTPHIEGMNQEMAETLFYGSEITAPEEFTGLAPRFNSLSAENADQIIDHGDSSDLTSIWCIVWGPQTAHGIYGKGFNAGLQMKDLGEVTVENVDSNGGRAQMYRSHYKWQAGLTVRDWRYISRVANIDTSTSGIFDPATNFANAQALINSMVQAAERIRSFGLGRPVWYVNRKVREALRLGILNKIANNLTWETVEGRRVMVFDDMPVRRTDALVNTETQVS